MKPLIIATRGSRLALWQAEYIAERLRALLAEQHSEQQVELLTVTTTGDAIQHQSLAELGGKGLFVKEIEEALLDGRADMAVHSMKDVPMELPEGLCLAAMPEREDPADMMLSVTYRGAFVLPAGATVGTSSLRRQALFLAARPDVRVEPVRGNVDTRLRKLQAGEFDAIIMAAAGVRRLGLVAPYMERLAPDRFLPAAGQGALGVEIRSDRKELLSLLAALDHRPTRLCIEAERAFLAALQGSCHIPVGAYAFMDEEGILLEGLIARTDGSECIRHTSRITDSNDLTTIRAAGAMLGQKILESGGRSILNSVLYSAGSAAPAETD